MEYLKLIAGFALLIISGDSLVRSGVSLAKHFKVSTLVIGVTIVSFGTSLPELFVSVQAAMDGYPAIAMGNVVGSNIANIALVLGITTLIFPLAVKPTTIRIDTPIMLFASGLLYYFILNNLIEWYEGLIFVFLLAVFLYWQFYKAKKDQIKQPMRNEKPKYSMVISVALLVIGTVGLRFGAKWLVDGAAAVARNFNVSETVISITLIAFGTSVPELVTSGIAALKKEPDISVGNIIGSNIFNIFGVLGVSALFKQVNIEPLVKSFHIWWMMGIAVLLFVFILPVLKSVLLRWKSLILLLAYIVYIYIMFQVEHVI